jgi:hypothetical protein
MVAFWVALLIVTETVSPLGGYAGPGAEIVPDRVMELVPALMDCDGVRLLNADVRARTFSVATVKSWLLIELSDAALVYVPVPADALVTLTLALLPDARFPKEQPRTWLPTEPVMEHVPGPLYAGLIDQFTPEPFGNGSFSATLSSIPGPALFTVIVNPIALPALTLAASGVLVTLNCPAVLGGKATTTSLNCLVFPPMPESTTSVALKNVVISNSNWQE